MLDFTTRQIKPFGSVGTISTFRPDRFVPFFFDAYKKSPLRIETYYVEAMYASQSLRQGINRDLGELLDILKRSISQIDQH